jgi:hypothetical protein
MMHEREEVKNIDNAITRTRVKHRRRLEHVIRAYARGYCSPLGHEGDHLLLLFL